jgi:hypothetical protein
MKTKVMQFRSLALLAAVLVVLLSTSNDAAGLTLTRRILRFDGKPAVGAKVRVVSDSYRRGARKETNIELETDANGFFTAGLPGCTMTVHIVVRAEGCAMACEYAVSMYSNGYQPKFQLRKPFKIKGKTLDAEGRPVGGAKISLVSARPKQWNTIPFNSAITKLINTPETTARSNSDGTWSMPGIDFMTNEKSESATLVFEAVSKNSLRVSRKVLQVRPAPRAEPQKDITLDFSMAPLIRVAGRVVNLSTGKPVAGAWLARNIVYTTLPGHSAKTDNAGKFELRIAGPLPLLWFWMHCDGFATTTVLTERRKQSASDWPETRNLTIPIRRLVKVSGRLLDENGKPPKESLVLRYNYKEDLDAMWRQKCASETRKLSVGNDGAFNAKLPTGRITIGVGLPLQVMGSCAMSGSNSKKYQLKEEAKIPAGGMKGLQLKMNRIIPKE